VYARALAISGNFLVVGDLPSHAYVYERVGCSWQQTPTQLTAPSGNGDRLFGFSVGISGNTAVVGALFNNRYCCDSEGRAYVYEKVGSTWQFVTQLTSPDGVPSNAFGFAVAVGNDGFTIVVSDPKDDEFVELGGAAYVFQKRRTGWQFVTKLTAPDAEFDDFFGSSLAIDGNGNTVVVGARFDEVTEPPGSRFGKAYIFERFRGSWLHHTSLIPSDGGHGDNFGYSVAVDGGTVVVGALRSNDSGRNSGSAYVYEKVNGSWLQQVTKLTPPDAERGDMFGRIVDISGDLIAVSADNFEGNRQEGGAAYVYEKSEGSWLSKSPVRVPAPQSEVRKRFGTAVAVDAGTVAIGSTGSPSGSVYLTSCLSSAYPPKPPVLTP